MSVTQNIKLLTGIVRYYYHFYIGQPKYRTVWLDTGHLATLPLSPQVASSVIRNRDPSTSGVGLILIRHSCAQSPIPLSCATDRTVNTQLAIVGLGSFIGMHAPLLQPIAAQWAGIIKKLRISSWLIVTDKNSYSCESPDSLRTRTRHPVRGSQITDTGSRGVDLAYS